MTWPRVLLCGGGTGGHVSPGIAVAEALRLSEPGATITFVGAGRPVERRLLDPVGIPALALPATPSPRLRTLARFGKTASRAMHAAWKLVGEVRPDIAVALGGYGALAPAIACWARGIPLVVLEQNMAPGQTTRLLSRIARSVHAPAHRGIAAWFAHPKRVHLTGNPVRRAALLPVPARSTRRDTAIHQAFRRAARRRLGLPEDLRAPVLLVLGGSQGAHSLNHFAIRAAPRIHRQLRQRLGSRGLSVLHLAGNASEAAACAAVYRAERVNALTLAFSDEPWIAYAAADLAISRAGAGVLAELSAAGLPSLLAPLVPSARDHQRANAERYASNGAAQVIAPDALNAATADLASHFLGHPALLTRASVAALSQGRPSAAAAVSRDIIQILSQEAPPIARDGQHGGVPWQAVRSSA